MMEKEIKEENKTLVITFRIFQAIFFGIFALGISMGLGDYGHAIRLPFSQFSITTTVFGLIGFAGFKDKDLGERDQ